MTDETFFTIGCPDCGPIDLTADQLWLVVPSVGEAHCDFFCPDCGEYTREEIAADAVEILAPLVAVEEVDVPAELLEVHEGPALTVDDLIDFMRDLEAA